MKIGKNLVAFITGGASGLGAATARRLHRQGAKVCIADMDELLMDKMRLELKTNVHTVKCDVSQ
jgi:NAD(P)-dependent dehydrogenase (short-subunit alcohol dehydrogenase family)